MSTDVAGLRIRRVAQGAWALWSVHQPALVVSVGMSPEEYQAALSAGGPNALGEAVRRRLDEGQDKLRALHAQLAEL
jgi:hypothetical protein